MRETRVVSATRCVKHMKSARCVRGGTGGLDRSEKANVLRSFLDLMRWMDRTSRPGKKGFVGPFREGH